MNEQKSDTLEQRKKAQRDFLELKKMQSGEIAAEAVREPEPPKTFSEKVKNFWYHYKAHTILSLFMVTALTIGITQCSTRPDYDAEIVLYTRNFYSAEQVEKLTEFLTPYFDDANGDGEVLIAISDCSYTTDKTFDSNETNNKAAKLNATIASGVEAQLYILDNKTLEQLDELAKNYGGFITDSVPLPDEVAEITDAQGYKIPEGLFIGRRVLKGTSMEKNDTAVAASDYALKVIDKIKSAD